MNSWKMTQVFALAVIGVLASIETPRAHTGLAAEFAVLRGEVVVDSFEVGVGCVDDFCDLTVDTDSNGDRLRRRDLFYFERWCGSNPLLVVVPAGAVEQTFTCEGPGQWRIEGRVTLQGGTHEVDTVVNFKVEALPPQ